MVWSELYGFVQWALICVLDESVGVFAGPTDSFGEVPEAEEQEGQRSRVYGPSTVSHQALVDLALPHCLSFGLILFSHSSGCGFAAVVGPGERVLFVVIADVGYSWTIPYPRECAVQYCSFGSACEHAMPR